MARCLAQRDGSDRDAPRKGREPGTRFARETAHALGAGPALNHRRCAVPSVIAPPARDCPGEEPTSTTSSAAACGANRARDSSTGCRRSRRVHEVGSCGAALCRTRIECTVTASSRGREAVSTRRAEPVAFNAGTNTDVIAQPMQPYAGRLPLFPAAGPRREGSADHAREPTTPRTPRPHTPRCALEQDQNEYAKTSGLTKTRANRCARDNQA